VRGRKQLFARLLHYDDAVVRRAASTFPDVQSALGGLGHGPGLFRTLLGDHHHLIHRRGGLGNGGGLVAQPGGLLGSAVEEIMCDSAQTLAGLGDVGVGSA
jgi:hypothetical protein